MTKLLNGILRGIIKLISLFNFRFLYLLSDFLRFFLQHVFGYRKKVILTNLKNSFPDKTDKELNGYLNCFYKNFCDVIVESVKMVSISRKAILSRVRFDNLEVLENYFINKQSVIAVCGHYCNWELGGLALSAIAKHKTIGVYKPLSSIDWDIYFTKLRSRFGMELVPMSLTLRKLIIYKKEVTLTTLISDQTPAKDDISFRTHFLNQDTAVFLGAEKIAKLTNSPVIFFTMNRIKRGYYSVHIEPITEHPNEEPEFSITQKHLQILEREIRNNPCNWLWSHRRWKY